MRTIIAAAICALLATTIGAAPADAASKSRHCGITTKWKLTGADDDGTTRIRLYSKPSAVGRAFCAEARDLQRTQNRVLIMATDGDGAKGLAWGADSASLLVRTAAASFYVEARVASNEPSLAVFTGWWA